METRSNRQCISRQEPAPWSVYIIRCADNTLYTGISTSVERRFVQHCRGGPKGARYLRGRSPLALVLSVVIGSRSDALRCEAGIKRLSRRDKLDLIAHPSRVRELLVSSRSNSTPQPVAQECSCLAQRSSPAAADRLPLLVVSDEEGRVFEIPHLRMTAMSANRVRVVHKDDVIPLPPGSDLFSLPGRAALGYDPVCGSIVEVSDYEGRPVRAVAAFMAPAHMQLARAAWKSLHGSARLPMYSYTAVGWRRGRFYVCGMRIDADQRQDCCHFDNARVRTRARTLARRHRENRLWVHLMENCVLRYTCPAARNLAMGRWEAPLPVSRSCNAACLACISEQPCTHCVTAPQERMDFVPTVDEIAGVAIPHLISAPRPVVSFGQGCEGEPLLYASLIEESIRAMRQKTSRGTINLNTNGSRPREVERLCRAGLDSMRVSLNSARSDWYVRYHRPRDYTFADVEASLRGAREQGCWTSLNYFIFPGFTDTLDELDALKGLIERTGVSMIQTRNLNMDPEWYGAQMGLENRCDKAVGMREWVREIRRCFPRLRLGYFNPPVR